MKNLFNLIFFISLYSLTIGQTDNYYYIDSALKTPKNVRYLKLGVESPTRWDVELPEKLIECKNLNKLYIGLHQNLNSPKLFQFLSKFTKLDTLEIYGCKLGTIPPEIGLLKHLKYLKLDLNNIQTISSEISKLTSLRFLSLANNKIISFPTEIVQLSTLQRLDINDCKIENLTDAIGNLTAISEINLKNNKLSVLPASIGQLQRLTSLNLSGNNVNELPLSLYNLKSLKTLDLSDNNIGALNDDISNLLNLERLDLSSNVTLKKIPEKISVLPNLMEIDLTNTLIHFLPEDLFFMPSLRSVKICKTLINNADDLDPKFNGVLHWSSNCKTLERLDVKLSELFGEESTEFIDSKETLYLTYNYSYDDPSVIDEEYGIKINIGIPRNLLKNQNSFKIPDSKISIKAKHYSIWHPNSEYENLTGIIEINEFTGEKIKLTLLLNGHLNEPTQSFEFINKKLLFEI